MKPKLTRKHRRLIAAALSVATVFTVAFSVAQNIQATEACKTMTTKATTTCKPTTTRATTTCKPTTTKATTTEATTTTTQTTTTAPTYSVVTGDWMSYGNYLAHVDNCGYNGDFGSAVVEVGVQYAFDDPAMAAPMTSAGTVGSPFGAWLIALANGTWYYTAYVKTADGNTYYGQIKSGEYP